MSDRVVIVTGTRAEYGLFSPLIDVLEAHASIEPSLLVTGAHLSGRHGMTVSEIEAAGREIFARVPVDLESDSEESIARATAEVLSGCASAFAADRPDLVVVLGDRYETFAAALGAFLQRIPVAHLHGGEVTQGALDEGLRHAITKLASVHFPATERYRRRVIQMGEEPGSVFAVGALGVDNAMRLAPMDAAALSADTGLDFDRPVAVVTFHPVTTLADGGLAEARELFSALDELVEVGVLLTLPNADAGNKAMLELERDWVDRHADRAVAHVFLGMERYLSAVRRAAVVVGNSSSGIIEAPSLGTPSVDVGERQSGRDRAESVFHVPAEREAIATAVRQAIGSEGARRAREAVNPYGDGHAAQRIASELATWLAGPRLAGHEFYDLPLDVTSWKDVTCSGD